MLVVFAEFSLSPLFRRKWSSTYEAIEDSRPKRNDERSSSQSEALDKAELCDDKVHRRSNIISNMYC